MLCENISYCPNRGYPIGSGNPAGLSVKGTFPNVVLLCPIPLQPWTLIYCSFNTHTLSPEQEGHHSRLTFRCAAYSVVAIAAPPLPEVRTGRSPVPRGHRHLAAPLGAAHPAGGRAWRPGPPGAHHTVDGCW